MNGAKVSLEKRDSKRRRKDRCCDDDILMFRGWMIWIIAEEIRKAGGQREEIFFGMEQPAVPQLEEVVRIWETEQCRNFAQAYGFRLQTFNQGDFGGRAKKPTGWGGNLSIRLPTVKGGGLARDVRGKSKEDILQEPRSLSRWAPGFMRAVAQ